MASGSDDIIQASQRPDGTWRKERKVKAGYIPPDEVEKYESRGTKFLKDMPEYPPGYVPPAEQAKPMTKNQKKNEKKKQRKKEKSQVGEEAPAKSTEPKKVVADQLPDKSLSELKISKDTSDSNNTDILKKIKAVKKKLKQIEQLIEKQTKGDVLEKEQLEKITRREEYHQELENLELELE